MKHMKRMTVAKALDWGLDGNVLGQVLNFLVQVLSTVLNSKDKSAA